MSAQPKSRGTRGGMRGGRGRAPRTGGRSQGGSRPQAGKNGKAQGANRPQPSQKANQNKGRSKDVRKQNVRELDIPDVPVKEQSPAEPKKERRLSEMDPGELANELKSKTLDSTGNQEELVLRLRDFALLVKTLSQEAKSAERTEAAEALVTSLTVDTDLALARRLAGIQLVESLKATIEQSGKKTGPCREGALAILHGLLHKAGASVLPVVLPLLGSLLLLSNDKCKKPREAASKVIQDMIEAASAFAPRLLFPELLKKAQKQANLDRMNIITELAKASPDAVKHCLVTAVPAVALVLHDVKPKVRKAARKALEALVAAGANDDVKPLTNTLLSALEDVKKVSDCVQILASTTFIQEVDGPNLAIISPILLRGFAVGSDKTSRACARIIENMSKLVEHPQDLASFLPRILPKLEEARDHLATPEAREVCKKACEILVAKAKCNEQTDMETKLVAELKAKGAEEGPMADTYVAYMIGLVGSLVATNNLDAAVWNDTLTRYLTCLVTDAQAGEIVTAMLDAAKSNVAEEKEEEDDDAEELCNCEFSLAYGNKVLLRKTKLRLKRGFKYGLIGQNDSGKTSLMRAIADHRVDGFPPEHELRTVFVETDIQGELSDLNVLEYMMADKTLAGLNIPIEEMTKTLQGVGFCDGSPANVTTCVGALSGGWKMKLALARAMLLNADILLLDEPTNHLDSYNVKWVEDYLMSLDNVTCVMVSHDSGFLNRVCTHIIQIDNWRLSYHKGNLESFVKKNPAAGHAFFELKTDKFKFSFPQPPRLKGINSKGKAIMKMKNISFTYPGAPAPQLKNVSIQVCLASRVACVGVNGAGKSTMIKLLTGELQPDEGSGEIWTHPNMSYGYIAQHAFHHIEAHLDKTPNEYICWRYRYGNDREATKKITSVTSPEEEAMMKKPVMFKYTDPESGLDVKKTGVVYRLTEGRKENKLLREQEYEAFLEKDESNRWWIPRSTLEKGGFTKMLKQVDDRINMREAMFSRPLTKENVRKHLDDVGLSEEFSTHMPIGSLSGGQKVKVVLGAALWLRPHVLILDEPTNYLDRDSLGALAQAIREFEGGVVMITHNSQFCDNLCPVVWHLQNNTLDIMGDAEWMAMDMKIADEQEEEGGDVDRFGNKIEKKKKLTAKQLKQKKKEKAKRRKARIKAGQDPEDTSDDDWEGIDI